MNFYIQRKILPVFINIETTVSFFFNYHLLYLASVKDIERERKGYVFAKNCTYAVLSYL